MKALTIANRISRTLRPMAVALSCAVGVYGTASAQMQDVQRPAQALTVIQSPYNVDGGAFRMTISEDHQRAGDLRLNTMAAHAEYGITDRLQLQATLPVVVNDMRGDFVARSGVDNISVGAQYSLTPSSDPVALSAALDVAAPIGKQESMMGNRGTSSVTWKPALSLATTAGGFGFHGSTQAELSQDKQALNSTIGSVYSLGVVAPALELSSRAVDGSKPEFYATPGAYIGISDRAQLGLGAAIGLNDRSDDLRVLAKLSVSLGR